MSRWARFVAVIVTVGALTACSSSDSTSEEVAELRVEVRTLTEQVEERDKAIDELTDRVADLEAAAAATATTDAPPTTTTTTETGDVEAILLSAQDLPGDWTSDPFSIDLGVADFGVEPFLTSDCGFGVPSGLDDPVAVAETAFVAGGPAGASVAVAVMRFDDERTLSQAVDRLAAETIDCETFFEDPDGRYDISPLAIDIEGVTVAGSASVFTPDEEASNAFGFGTTSHDVVARVGPYLLIASQLVFEGEPDLAVTEAAIEALVANAAEVAGSTS